MAPLAQQTVFPRRVLYLIAGIAGIAFATSIFLWFKLGSAVFFESIRAGFAYCFG